MSAPLAPVQWSHSVWHLEITKLLSVVAGAKVAECFVSDCFTYESDVAVGEKEVCSACVPTREVNDVICVIVYVVHRHHAHHGRLPYVT